MKTTNEALALANRCLREGDKAMHVGKGATPALGDGRRGHEENRPMGRTASHHTQQGALHDRTD